MVKGQLTGCGLLGYSHVSCIFNRSIQLFVCFAVFFIKVLSSEGLHKSNSEPLGFQGFQTLILSDLFIVVVHCT